VETIEEAESLGRFDLSIVRQRATRPQGGGTAPPRALSLWPLSRPATPHRTHGHRGVEDRHRAARAPLGLRPRRRRRPAVEEGECLRSPPPRDRTQDARAPPESAATNSGPQQHQVRAHHRGTQRGLVLGDQARPPPSELGPGGSTADW